MILASFPAVVAWAAASPQDDRPRSSSHPGRSAPEALEGWGAAQPRESSALSEGTSTTAAVTWTYDALGRTTQKEMTGPGGPSVYTWVWDTAWKGSRTRVTDPQGQTDSTYGAGPFGGWAR